MDLDQIRAQHARLQRVRESVPGYARDQIHRTGGHITQEFLQDAGGRTHWFIEYQRFVDLEIEGIPVRRTLLHLWHGTVGGSVSFSRQVTRSSTVINYLPQGPLLYVLSSVDFIVYMNGQQWDGY